MQENTEYKKDKRQKQIKTEYKIIPSKALNLRLSAHHIIILQTVCTVCGINTAPLFHLADVQTHTLRLLNARVVFTVVINRKWFCVVQVQPRMAKSIFL